MEKYLSVAHYISSYVGDKPIHLLVIPLWALVISITGLVLNYIQDIKENPYVEETNGSELD